MIEIRLASIADLWSIDRIYNQAIEMKMATADTIPYSKAEREEWFRKHEPDKFPAYVAIEGSDVSGYMTLSSYRPRREALKYVVEISYFVDERYRGMGIGTKLLEHGLALASQLGYKTVVAILMGHNEASIGLLKKFGFAEWGRLPGIAKYGNNWFDHLHYGLKI